MTTTLSYLLIAFSTPTWHGSLVLHATTSQARCEAIATQLRATGGRYECHTLVSATPAKAGESIQQ